MSRSSARIVSLLMAIAILSDSSWGALSFSPRRQRPKISSSFMQQEALIPYLVSGFHAPYNPLSFFIAKIAPKSQPAEGWLDYERVERHERRRPFFGNLFMSATGSDA